MKRIFNGFFIKPEPLYHGFINCQGLFLNVSIIYFMSHVPVLIGNHTAFNSIPLYLLDYFSIWGIFSGSRSKVVGRSISRQETLSNLLQGSAS